MYRIKAKITSLHANAVFVENLQTGFEVLITIAAIGDYSVAEIETSSERKMAWNVFVEQVSEKTGKKTRRAVLYPTTEMISVDPSFHSIVQEIYFQQHAVVFEVNITSSSDNSISIYKIILGDK